MPTFRLRVEAELLQLFHGPSSSLTMEKKRSCPPSLGVLLLALLSVNGLKSVEAASFLPRRVAFPIQSRGGSTRAAPLDSANQDSDDEDKEEEDPEVLKRRQIVRRYRLEQQQLMQLRSTILSEALAKRGIPLITLLDVSTPDGQKPPQKVDWDCALSTQDEPKVSITSQTMPVASWINIFLTGRLLLNQYHSLASTLLMQNLTRRLSLLLIPHNGFHSLHSIAFEELIQPK